MYDTSIADSYAAAAAAAARHATRLSYVLSDSLVCVTVMYLRSELGGTARDREEMMRYKPRYRQFSWRLEGAAQTRPATTPFRRRPANPIDIATAVSEPIPLCVWSIDDVVDLRDGSQAGLDRNVVVLSVEQGLPDVDYATCAAWSIHRNKLQCTTAFIAYLPPSPPF